MAEERRGEEVEEEEEEEGEEEKRSGRGGHQVPTCRVTGQPAVQKETTGRHQVARQDQACQANGPKIIHQPCATYL